MITQITKMGVGYTGPSYYALRVPLLKEAKLYCEAYVNKLRSKWAETGCTIMGDGWKDKSDRSLVNFLVYCSDGISFIKSVDVFHCETKVELLCDLFAEIVEMVGPKNIVHLIIDNAANYKKAEKLLNRRYPTIFWSPCAAHCVNLIMQDIGNLPSKKDLVILASKITCFIYNHKWPHAWLSRRPAWTEIVRPADTRFGTTFIALKSICDRKEHLEQMVVDPEFRRKFLKIEKGKEVKQIILDGHFWNNCQIIVKIIGPLMRLLRICDSDERPALGYVAKGMWRAIRGIKELFKQNDHLFRPYINIIEDRWDKMLRKDLHAAALFLNPTFQYDPESPAREPEALAGLLKVVHKFCPEESGIVEEITKSQERKGNFGLDLAKRSYKKVRPDDFWKVLGSDAPNLRKIAIKILSQTSASSGCERNWSVFERIHTKKRNRLEHQMLNDLVYVHYNLRLEKRLESKKRAYDPVVYECIDKVEFWVVEETPGPELNNDDMDEMLENENTVPSTGGNDDVFDGRNDQVDLSNIEFGGVE